MTLVHVAVNGTYRNTINIQPTRGEIEATIAEIKTQENCVISADRRRVYNSYMTPLFTNGEIMIAYRNGARLVRDFRYK